MERYRPIRKYGDSILIRISKQDLIDMNAVIGDFIDISKFKIKEANNGTEENK